MASIIETFANLPDPRTKEHKKEHKLIDIVFITIAAVICGADDWYEIEEYGRYKAEWLKTVLELPNGIPSHDTFNRVFSLIDPHALHECFLRWVQSIAQIGEGQLVSIDGKQLCNSGEKGKKAIIHMVSAWSNSNRLTLGQLKVNDKSNEITAIPALLDVLMVQGCWVSIDAMGCQKKIAAKIKERGGEYLLAVKENQGHLYDDIKEAFAHGDADQADTKHSTGHGRIETRSCRVITDTDWICSSKDWVGLQTLVEVTGKRTIKATGETTTHTRYYIGSMAADAVKINWAVREHWGIENVQHWVLDVVFGEDGSTKRAGNAAQNFSVITKIALNVVNQSNDCRGARKLSIKTKRKKAGWDNDYLLHMLAKAT
jgi:predicted transposase YbfD/YdcC